jgi:hypothetical protein
MSSLPPSPSRRLPLIGLGVAGLFACLCIVVAALAAYLYLRPQPTTELPAVEYILDVSSRMSQPAEGGDTSRLIVARTVMAGILQPSADTIAGLRVFGSGAAGQPCDDTSLLVPLEAASQQRITGELATLQAGQTADAPLAPAIIAAIRDLAAVEGPKSLVVITGGQDSCRAEAGLLIAQEAERAGIELRTFVIGFQTEPAEAEAIKEMVATAGDGHYLDAPDEAALKEALEEVQKYVEKPTAETLAAVAAKASTLPLNLTQTTGISYGPQIALDGDNNLHLVWWDNTTRPSGDILYRQRTPDGNWTPTESLTADLGLIGQYELQLRVRPDGAVCAFYLVAEELRYDYRCRLAGVWQAPQPAFSATGIKREMQPAFAPDGTVHVIYLDGAADIFSGEQELSGPTDTAMTPRLAVDSNGRLHAVYFTQDDTYTIQYRWSDDGGQSWAAAESVATLAAGVPLIALEADLAGNVHLAWSTGSEIDYRLWTPAAGWQPMTTVDAANGRPDCNNIALAIDSAGRPHIAWQTYAGVSYAIQQADQSWAVSAPITAANCQFSRVPALALGRDGLAHFIYSLGTDDQDLFYAAVPTN